MKVYPPRDIRPFVMYCVNGKPRSSLLIESTDSMIVDYDCLVVNEEIITLEQTSLLQSLHREKYQFHKIIKVYFAKKALASRMNCNDFWKVFFRTIQISFIPFPQHSLRTISHPLRP